MTVSFILAGAVWPDAPVRDALAARIADACPGAEVIEARDARDAPRGAAAVIGDAIRGARGDVVVVLEPWAALGVEALRALAAAGGTGLAIEAGPDVAAVAWPPAPAGADLVSELAESAASASLASIDGRPMPAWAIRKMTLEDVGGLDPAWWSVGILEDLAARLVTAAVVPVDTGASGGRASAWPLDPALHAFLARRNRILTAFRSLPADRLGVELARVSVEALRAATAASGLTGDQFHFGGGWGAAEGALARLLRPGADGASYLADHFGTLAPLLALDSALDELPRLLDVRRPGAEPAPQPGPQPTAEPAAQPAAASHEQPSASVVIVTWNGREHLGPCLSSLAASDYPADRLEVVVVDNGSSDGTVDWIARQHPRVRVVPLASNQGFTGGNTAGVAAATGDVLVFFNNDMRVEPDTVRRLVAAAADGTACAAARVLSWDGRAIDFLRGTISFEARGFQD